MSNNEQDGIEHKVQGPTQSQNEALQRAARAAKDLKPLEMVDALHQSFLLDGLTTRIRRNWSSFSLHDAEDIVSESVDILYQSVLSGKPVGSITSFLNKVAHRKAFDLWSKRRFVTSFPPGSPELEILSDDPSVTDRSKAPSKPGEMPDREVAIKQSIAIARRLLPQLGQENIRLVMSLIFDALEAGKQDISNQEIGDALGLSSDTVRQSKSRGFRRLEELAKKEGILTKDFGLKAIGREEGGDDGEETAEN